jgi:hypothetical protein
MTKIDDGRVGDFMLKVLEATIQSGYSFKEGAAIFKALSSVMAKIDANPNVADNLMVDLITDSLKEGFN